MTTNEALTPYRRKLSTSEAAQHLGIGKSTLDKLRLTGGGPDFIRPTPRRVTYDIHDLDKWAEARKHADTSESTATAV